MKKLFVFFLMFLSLTAMTSEPGVSGQAKWIWNSQTFHNDSMVYFRRKFTLEAEVAEARLLVCFDDGCRLLSVNGVTSKRLPDPPQPGKPIRVMSYDVAPLHQGENVLALAVHNNIAVAGVILRLDLKLVNGKKFSLVTDSEFKTSDEASDGFDQPDFDDSRWTPAVVLGDVSYPAWKNLTCVDEFFLSPEEKAWRQKLSAEAADYVKRIDYAMPGDGIGAVKWIWYPEIAVAVPKTPRYFFKKFDVAQMPATAEFTAIADDACSITINGQAATQEVPLVQSPSALPAHRFEVGSLLKPGTNEIMVKVENVAGDAGLIAELRLAHADGSQQRVITDGTWTSAKEPDGEQAAVWVMGDGLCWPWQDISNAYEVFMSPQEKANQAAWQKEVDDVEKRLNLGSEPDASARLVRQGGQPAIEINGEIVPPILYIVWLNGRMGGMLPARSSGNVAKMHNNGIDLVQYPVPLREYMTEDGTGNGAYLRNVSNAVRQILAANPNAHLVLTVSMEAPSWYKQANPDECVLYVTGRGEPGLDAIRQTLAISMASDKWRQDATVALEKMLGELKRELWFKRVVGFRIGYGVYSEWHYYGMSRHMPDIGPRMTEKFRQYLAAHYGSDDALRQAWRNENVTLDSALVPGRTERENKFRFIRDFTDPNDRQVLDYYDCQQKVTADLLLAWAKEFKRIAPGRLVGAWYGYVFEMAYPADGQTVEYDRVLSSPYIDFLSSPYGYGPKNRRPGGDGHPRIISSPFTRYGKLAFFEDDSRTHLAGAPHELNADTPRQSESILKRNFSVCLIDKIGLQFNDLGNHWNIPGVFTDPLQLAVINRVTRIMAHLRQENPPSGAADIAAVYDPREMARHNHTVHPIFMIDALSDETLHAMRQTGRPITVLTLEDYLKSPHKFQFAAFLNAFSPSQDERRKMQEKLARDGSHAAWLYAPGLSTETGLSDEAMRELTGLGLTADYRRLPLAVKDAEGHVMRYSVKDLLNQRYGRVDTS
ncbi:MAG: beta-galactosidase, partial [Victivallales bacterium]|nr:beta-galactosidase [Victivallales bacterium]